MKRIISILFLLLAMTTYLAHGIVPHHEHGVEICFNGDCCEVNNSCSHGHSDHSSESHTCLVKAQSVVVQSKDSKCSCGTDSMHAHDFIIPLFLLTQTTFESESKENIYDAYSEIYASSYFPHANALRGPPSVA